MIIVRNLKILPEFENEIRRLTEEEFKNLTERILEDGAIREKIIVLKGTDYIVDGHHRYKIAMEYNIFRCYWRWLSMMRDVADGST